MAHSDLFLPTKLGALPSPFTNNYLLKHGNIFIKPNVLKNGLSTYPFLSNESCYTSANGTANAITSVAPSYDAPLDFVIKHEKPPTPPASTSPVGSKTPPPHAEKVEQQNDQSKNTTWILGKQKLSWDNSTVASYNPETKMFRCVVCNAVGFLSRIAEHYLGTHTSAKVFQCLHCPYSSTWSRCVRMHMAKHHGVPNAPPSLWKGQPLLEEIFLLLTNLKTTVDSQGRDRTDPEFCDKKFICPKCPYTTDRRDLYLRHENIHKEDKPYHCYICFKLFNRADHVKKHFLRIHRGHPYDISLVRRRPPRNSSSSTSLLSNVKASADAPTACSKANIKNSVTDFALKNGSCDAILKENNGIFPWNRCVPAGGHKQVKGFECPFCTWEGVDAWCLRRHMNVHTKAHCCPICEFKTSKAEKLFTHVYKTHKMLVCTKCKFVSDQAHHFEGHIKACCAEIVLGTPKEKQLCSDDSPNDSDNSVSSSVKQELHVFSKNSDVSLLKHFPMANVSSATTKCSERFSTTPADLKGSVSIIPLHNSISYCFPSQAPPFTFNDGNSYAGEGNTSDETTDSPINSDLMRPSLNNDLKTEFKGELSSPVQSSADSGVADLTSDQNDIDLTCWHCGCEFADESSLNTHTELYHRSLRVGRSSDNSDSRSVDKKKFSCTLCNFSSGEQTTILDHMRYHTGETLLCRAGYPCTFTTIFDATLREHVLKEHTDGNPRCPHCGFHCTERTTFIRHYRKFHHSTSCYRCRCLRRQYSEAITDNSSTIVRPYLHHNPYAKSTNGVTMPYAHRDSAMSKIAVSIPSLTFEEPIHETWEFNKNQGERRARKQSAPRKLIHQTPKSRSVNMSPTDSVHACDKTRKSGKSSVESLRRKCGEKYNFRQFWYCRMCYDKPMCYRNRVNFLVHSIWLHHGRKFKCKSCNKRFRHKYQILLHNRRGHDSGVYAVKQL